MIATRSMLCAALVLAAASTTARADESDAGTQAILLNATTKLGDLGQIDKIRRVMDSKGLLAKLPENLEATLAGRSVLVEDAEAIRDAYQNLEYASALKIIQRNEERILANTSGGDPLPALVELAQWRGLIAAMTDKPDEAIRQFRAAYTFNPTWNLDKKLVQPRVRGLIKKARKDSEGTGRLRVEVDPETAMMAIDGGKPQPVTEKLQLPEGIHLVVVTAPGRTSYSELVEIKADKLEKLPITLDAESKDDKAARLVNATVTAPPGESRLKKVRKLSQVTGVNLTLVIEDSIDDRVTVRVYDPTSKKVSKPLEIEDSASNTAIARKVMAALNPDNMIDPTTVIVVNNERPAAPKRWYQRWYVWAAVGAVVGGGAIGYHYATREPTMVRF